MCETQLELKLTLDNDKGVTMTGHAEMNDPIAAIWRYIYTESYKHSNTSIPYEIPICI